MKGLKITHKQIIIFAIIVVVIIGLIIWGKGSKKKSVEARRECYDYPVEFLIVEGGYSSATKYANQIFEEVYCTNLGTIYSEAIKDHDLEERELVFSFFTADGKAFTNNLYLCYKIPGAKELKGYNSEGSPEYSEKATQYVALIFNNFVRESAKNYICSNISMIDLRTSILGTLRADETTRTYFENNIAAVDCKGVQQHSLLDYGIIYNSDKEMGEFIYETERAKIIDYLVAKHDFYKEDFVFASNPDLSGVMSVESTYMERQETREPIADYDERRGQTVSQNSVTESKEKEEEKDKKENDKETVSENNTLLENTVSENQTEE